MQIISANTVNVLGTIITDSLNPFEGCLTTCDGRHCTKVCNGFIQRCVITEEEWHQMELDREFKEAMNRVDHQIKKLPDDYTPKIMLKRIYSLMEKASDIKNQTERQQLINSQLKPLEKELDNFMESEELKTEMKQIALKKAVETMIKLIFYAFIFAIAIFAFVLCIS